MTHSLVGAVSIAIVTSKHWTAPGPHECELSHLAASWRASDQRSISASTSLVRAAMSNGPAVGAARTAKPGCDDVTPAAAELGKEGRRGRRMLDHRDHHPAAREGAVWQVEGE